MDIPTSQSINDLVQHAVAFEGQGHTDRARDMYVKAVELLLQSLQFTEDPIERSTLTNRANSLLRTAETLPHGVTLPYGHCTHHI